MALKRADYMTYGDDRQCDEIREFIEKAGVLLIVRDMKTNPLTVRELDQLFGHIPLTHFLDMTSPSFKKHGLDNGLPDRDTLLKLMAEDPALIRRPIIRTTRLLTVGSDREKISQMLQLGESANGNNVTNLRQPQRIVSAR